MVDRQHGMRENTSKILSYLERHQFRHLRALKRAGRGNDAIRKVEETEPGELAVECPACPHPGINLPEGWESAMKEQKFIYTLFIAVDACFRLKCKIVSSDAKDPGLGPGWAYFVEDEPYREYWKTLGDQPDMSSCTGLSAVDHANTRFSRGYATTGVGLALCARHEIIGKNAVGDLQKGEKYGNMTYVVASWLRHISQLLAILVSYDINCQFSKNFAERVGKLPPLVRFVVVSAMFRWIIPKLHILGHKLSCQREFNLNYTDGAARTDGEGVEHPWANIRPVSTSTQEMGPGHRHDTLDNHWHDWNWRKIVGLAKLLARKALEAKEEREVQENAFQAFSDNQWDDVPGWMVMVKEWESDDTKPNPYEGKKSLITLQEVRLQLSTEDSLLAERGMPAVHETTPAKFLLIGLDLEDQQRRLQQDISKIRGVPTTKQAADLLDKRNRLMRAISRFHSVQTVYMPATVQMLVDLAKKTSINGAAVPAERTVLLLPSEVPRVQRRSGAMMAGLNDMEMRLRHAQCQDALAGLRNQLLIKSRLLTYKIYNARHQGATTRSRGLVDRNEVKVSAHARRYQAVWQALASLADGGSEKVQWKKLEPGDIKVMQEVEETVKERKKRKRKGKKTKENENPTEKVSEGHQVLSWIWTESAAGGLPTDDALKDGLHVEWSKAWSRVRRWREEELLLSEEMRRILVTFEWNAQQWEKRGVVPEFEGIRAAGAAAYAAKQVAVWRCLSARCRELWKLGGSVNLEKDENAASIPPDVEGEEVEEAERDAQEGDDLILDPADDPIW
ncbi:hypothetical protein C8J56DRAFT_1061475 [Mycena floridula]|nr:hypothetical protein C8J56DRAFT_1061475 [Mycena floridula]